MNKIRKVELILRDTGRYDVQVTKEYAPLNGGGFYVFKDTARDLPEALRVQGGLILMAPDRNPSRVRS